MTKAFQQTHDSQRVSDYLQTSPIIDWDEPTVLAKAQELSQGRTTDEGITKACFEFVRDEIKHSWDYRMNPVTLKASEVLKHQTGYCYSKSHLLAALLRANQIPAALCYQRLTIENNQPPFCLHGLNAVHLEKHGWVRLDARGNKEGINAQFNPPNEILAFEIKTKGEKNLEQRYVEPIAEVVEILTRFKDIESVAENLPDLD